MWLKALVTGSFLFCVSVITFSAVSICSVYEDNQPQYKPGDCITLLPDTEEWEDQHILKILKVGKEKYLTTHWVDGGWLGKDSWTFFLLNHNSKQVECPR